MAEQPLSEFLYSGALVQLRSSDSNQPFYVHKALLESKCKVIYSALSRGFLESQEGVYTCTDTTHATLARAVEWMYSGNYPLLSKQELGADARQDSMDTRQEEKANNLSELAEEMKNHPVMTHLQLYIFGEVYLIPDLKQAAHEELTRWCSCIVQGLSPPQALIALLHMAFSNIKPDDRLLHWFAHFSSWRLDVLRQQPLFNDLLLEHPVLGSLMMASVRPASDYPYY
ncbi:hypothetical protein P170DRAFT_422176 [Aspergillus steynii IBT 23096]|uniref:BTB domain-containing protein n=1 Tax=Aspergillus steynii IBT 23096 TaxID=1392250 RepID=A0A2I2GRZ4_9EURO|nr:uncharacterized protein P170DRAFT_422176 [Aspergillus steynii IBT 23096]PLB55646.1 hypothetical protein P170DRAFT_422176 [Aspergillus steynii IBT 23096]